MPPCKSTPIKTYNAKRMNFSTHHLDYSDIFQIYEGYSMDPTGISSNEILSFFLSNIFHNNNTPGLQFLLTIDNQKGWKLDEQQLLRLATHYQKWEMIEMIQSWGNARNRRSSWPQ
eukprot:Awhi_evm1s4260